MATHADAVREAERAVVEAAVEWDARPGGVAALNATAALYDAIKALLALRAATCSVCGGTGEITVASTRGGYATDDIRCPAGCERGKRRTT